MRFPWKIFLNLKIFKIWSRSGRGFRRSLLVVKNRFVTIYTRTKFHENRNRHERCYNKKSTEIPWKIFLNLKFNQIWSESGRCFLPGLLVVKNDVVTIYTRGKSHGIRGNRGISHIMKDVFLSNIMTF